MQHVNAPIHYRISATAPHAHLFDVELVIAAPAAKQVVSLPAWIPGSYLIREFARHIQSMQASQAGQSCTLVQRSKNTWEIHANPQQALHLQYRVYAFDNSVRAAWLDVDRAFFNPTSLCLRVHGAENLKHNLQLPPPSHTQAWQVATALLPSEIDQAGFGLYSAKDYDELADSPVEMGHFWHGQFEARGIPHHFIVAGAGPAFDGARLIADSQKICEAAIDFWHPNSDGASTSPIPHDRYFFLLNAVDNGYGGLEHRHSTALICNRSDLPRLGQTAASDGYQTLLGLISHEYFHTWNVKRMRPAEFSAYDYEQENYTELLWFFEGFTSYYDDLLLHRAGLLSDEQYLKVLAKTIHQVAQTPGRQVQSVAQASFDAWVKYYRQDENTANATVSYYTKGALVALCLDLSLRSHANQNAPHTSLNLDALMRQLWSNSQGGPISEADILQALTLLTGKDWRTQLHEWVHTTQALPLTQLLTLFGVELSSKPATWPQRLGLLAQESNGSVLIRRVQSGSVAEQSGLAVGDEWLGLQIPHQKASSAGWRLKKLDDLSQLLPANAAWPEDSQALVNRDGQLRWLPLAQCPADIQGEVQLTIQDEAALHKWL